MSAYDGFGPREERIFKVKIDCNSLSRDHDIVLRMDIFCLSQNSLFISTPQWKIQSSKAALLFELQDCQSYNELCHENQHATRTEDYERCHTRDEKILQDVQHEIVTNDREAPDPAPTDGVEGLGVQMDAGVTITVKVPKGVYCALEAGAADGGEGNGVTNVAETAGEVCGLLFEILAA